MFVQAGRMSRALWSKLELEQFAQNHLALNLSTAALQQTCRSYSSCWILPEHNRTYYTMLRSSSWLGVDVPGLATLAPQTRLPGAIPQILERLVKLRENLLYTENVGWICIRTGYMEAPAIYINFLLVCEAQGTTHGAVCGLSSWPTMQAIQTMHNYVGVSLHHWFLASAGSYFIRRHDHQTQLLSKGMWDWTTIGDLMHGMSHLDAFQPFYSSCITSGRPLLRCELEFANLRQRISKYFEHLCHNLLVYVCVA